MSDQPENRKLAGLGEILSPDTVGVTASAVRGRLQHCNIYVRSHRAGERGMTSVSWFLTTKLRLKVNETKSAVARPEKRKFLDSASRVTGASGVLRQRPSTKFKERIREMTIRTRGLSLSQTIGELTPYLVGWSSYFGF